MPPDTPPPNITQPLYVSIREGALVPRFTLAGKVSGYIGAERGEGRAYVWRPDVITMIPAVEAVKHRKAYGHALANGDLVPRTADEFEAQQRAALQKKEQREADASHSGSTSASAGGEQ